MRQKSMLSVMLISVLILSLSACSSAPKQQVVLPTPCPDPVKVDPKLRKELHDLLQQNYRQRILENLTKQYD